MVLAMLVAAALQPQDPRDEEIRQLRDQLDKVTLKWLRLQYGVETDAQKRMELIRDEALRSPFKSANLFGLEQAARFTQEGFLDVLPAVAALAQNGEPERALAAVDVLSKFAALDPAQSAIQEASKHPNAVVRVAVATALRSVRTEAALAVLVALLRDEPEVRKAAAIAAAEHENAGGPIFDLMKTETDPEVRKELIDGLGTLRYAPAVDALLSELKRAEGNVLWATINALGKIGDPRAYAAIEPHLRSTQEHIRLVTVQSIGRLNLKEGQRKLSELLADAAENATIRKACAVALAACGDPAVAHDVLLPILMAEADAGVRDAIWKAVLDLTEGAVEARLQLMARLIEKQRTREAALLCTRFHGAELSAEQTDAYAPLGRAVADALFDGGEHQEALAHYRNVSALRPPEATLTQRVVACGRALGDLDAAAQFAMSEFKRATAANDDRWAIGDLRLELSREREDAFSRARTIHELMHPNPAAPPEETLKRWKAAYDEAAAGVRAALPGSDDAQKRAAGLGRAIILPMADWIEAESPPEEHAVFLQLGNYIAGTKFEAAVLTDPAERARVAKEWRAWHDRP